MSKLIVEVYARKDCKHCFCFAKWPNCTLCNEARAVINRVNNDVPFLFKEIDINTNEDLKRRYTENIPTVVINGKKAFKFKVDEAEFRKKIRKEFIKASVERLWVKKGEFNS